MKDEKEYFCENIRQCKNSMYALAYGMLKNENDAADVMQDAILKAYSNLDKLKDRKKFKPWILKILHNTAVDFIHKRQILINVGEHEEIPEQINAVDKETKITLWEAVQKVRLPYRTVLILFYYEDYSVLQIAQIMSTSAINIRKQLSRARKMLAELLNREDFL